MSKSKKPDQVVFNSKTQQYDAHLKPYATNVGAPSIKTSDNTPWKRRGIQKVNHRIESKFQEIKAKFEKLMDEYNYNNLIYNAQFSFEPIPGETYYLYKRVNGDIFLSLISPEQCNFNWLGSFYLNSDFIWKKHHTDDKAKE